MNTLGVCLNRDNVGLFSGYLVATFTLLLSVYLLLFVDLPRGLFWSALQNSGHTLVFAVLTLSCLLSIGLRAKTKTLPMPIILSAVAAILLFSCGVEFVQSLIGREASFGDMVLNGAGIVVGTVMYLVYRMGRLYSTAQICLLLLAIVIVGVSFRHPIRYLVAELSRPPLPILANFEHMGASMKVEAVYGATAVIVNNSKKWLSNSTNVLEVHFPPGEWPGFALLELHANWTEYSELYFEVFNTSSNAIEVNLRIHDLFHNNEVNDLYRQRLIINPGIRTVTIAIEDIRVERVVGQREREIDIANIYALKVYTTKVQSMENMLFDNFYLR